MKAMTSKEREAARRPIILAPHRHPPAIQGHVHIIARGESRGTKYYAVFNKPVGAARCNKSTFGASDNEWEDITDQVYLNTDELES